MSRVARGGHVVLIAFLSSAYVAGALLVHGSAGAVLSAASFAVLAVHCYWLLRSS